MRTWLPTYVHIVNFVRRFPFWDVPKKENSGFEIHSYMDVLFIYFNFSIHISSVTYLELLYIYIYIWLVDVTIISIHCTLNLFIVVRIKEK